MANNPNETILKNRYRLVSQQGSGGMAVIYKAIDPELSRTVAVKILRPSLTNDPAFLVRFKTEAKSAANLMHPNIVTVYDVGNEGPTHFIVMEFVEGTDLKKIIKTDGVLTVERALKLVIQICAGIGYAHRAGLVHADVKPQNILVTKGDVVKVTDFGIAQAFSDTQPQAERAAVVWGSPHYFAPEQARGEKPTPASDVYSIGIVLFEMLTGRLPYTGVDQQQLALAHIRDRIPMVTEINPAVPDTLAQIIYKVMSKEPAMRYRTADQLGQVLESYRSRGREQTMANPPPAYGQPPATPSPYAPPPLPFTQAQQPPPPPPLPFTQAQPTPPMPLPFTQPQQPTFPPAPNMNVPYPLDPTQRYNAAPNAPQAPAYNRPGVPSPFERPAEAGQAAYSQVVPGQPLPPATPAQPWMTSSSQQLYSRPLDREDDIPPALDAVTIALAVMAFFAVLCLIPLWVQVYLARFAGG